MTALLLALAVATSIVDPVCGAGCHSDERMLIVGLFGSFCTLCGSLVGVATGWMLCGLLRPKETTP